MIVASTLELFFAKRQNEMLGILRSTGHSQASELRAD